MFILFPVLPVYVCITNQKLNFASLSPREDAEYSTNASFSARRAQINFLSLCDNAGLPATELILKFKIDNAVTRSIVHSVPGLSASFKIENNYL